jgi:hypothetical protein
MHAGVTRVRFSPENADKVISDLKGPILDEHKKLRNEGLRDAFFLVNREAGEAIGVAIWDDRGKLEKHEGKTTRHDPGGVRDPGKAPTDFAKKRAKAIQDEGATMENSDWYEVVART